jgi:hypothetical protein
MKITRQLTTSKDLGLLNRGAVEESSGLEDL